MSAEKIHLFIARAWVEDGSEKPLRLRIRLTDDLGASPMQRSIILADRQAAMAEFDAWLDAVLEGLVAPVL